MTTKRTVSSLLLTRALILRGSPIRTRILLFLFDARKITPGFLGCPPGMLLSSFGNPVSCLARFGNIDGSLLPCCCRAGRVRPQNSTRGLTYENPLFPSFTYHISLSLNSVLFVNRAIMGITMKDENHLIKEFISMFCQMVIFKPEDKKGTKKHQWAIMMAFNGRVDKAKKEYFRQLDSVYDDPRLTFEEKYSIRGKMRRR